MTSFELRAQIIRVDPNHNIMILSFNDFKFESDSGIEDENGVVAEVVTNGQAEQIKVISRQPTTKTEVNSFKEDSRKFWQST